MFKARFLMLAVCLLGTTSPAPAQSSLDDLSWIAGAWSGDAWGGRFSANYSTAASGLLMSYSRLQKGDRDISYYEFEVFSLRDGKVHLQPFPSGKKAGGFFLTECDPQVRRVAFENPKKDYPTRIVYHCVTPDRLVITLDDPHGGSKKTDRFDLERVNEAPWITLFNGKDLSGWTPKIKGFAAGENFADTFRVQDGAIVVGYEGYDKFDGRFGHLFFEHEYTNYTLELEYRFTGTQLPDAPGWAFRNSGIMIHGQSPQSMRVDQDFPVSVEVQLLGGDGIQDRHTANVCSPGTDLSLDGKKARAHCNDSRSKTYHGDEWVKVRVVVRGHELVRHEIDGEVVLEYGNLRLDARDADAKAIIEAHDGETQLGRGTLSLQSESHPCAFRNIRLRVDE